MDEIEAERELLRRIRTEGVLVAYETALAICQDPKAPAPAKATASASLFRVGGYFNRTDEGRSDKQAHEMTPDELEREIARIQRSGKARPPGIFD